MSGLVTNLNSYNSKLPLPKKNIDKANKIIINSKGIFK
jgi:hypothetical protein